MTYLLEVMIKQKMGLISRENELEPIPTKLESSRPEPKKLFYSRPVMYSDIFNTFTSNYFTIYNTYLTFCCYEKYHTCKV